MLRHTLEIVHQQMYSGLYHLMGLTAHNFWSWSQRVEILFAESLQREKEKSILPLSWLSLDCQFQSHLRVAFSRGPFVFDLTARIMVASLLQVDCLPVIWNPIWSRSGFFLCSHHFIKLTLVDFPLNVVGSYLNVIENGIVGMVPLVLDA